MSVKLCNMKKFLTDRALWIDWAIFITCLPYKWMTKQGGLKPTKAITARKTSTLRISVTFRVPTVDNCLMSLGVAAPATILTKAHQHRFIIQWFRETLNSNINSTPVWIILQTKTSQYQVRDYCHWSRCKHQANLTRRCIYKWWINIKGSKLLTV